jgi:predicted Zn-dependent protease
MADLLESRYTPAKDVAENAYLEQIGTRLLAVLPPTHIKFHFVLVDSVEINGFSLAGGRVYITRKLVANAHNEDEVAGVIAHEMGHILSHQFANENDSRYETSAGSHQRWRPGGHLREVPTVLRWRTSTWEVRCGSPHSSKEGRTWFC